MPRRDEEQLPFGPVRNANLFANHWLERRLPDEPEWSAARDTARECLEELARLWAEQGRIVEGGASEAEIEQSWIRPALERMGWSVLARATIHGRVPDLALFLDAATRDRAFGVGTTNPEFWRHPTVVADAKAWGVSLDRPTRGGGGREFPPEQIEWYLNHTAVDWGLLTNGRLWRLIPRIIGREQRRLETYLELDLPLLISRWTGTGGVPARSDAVLEEWLRWYVLATPVAFRTTLAPTSLIERALAGSGAYRLGVGERLREQVFSALRLCIDGFFAHAPNDLDRNRPEDLERARAGSFTLLFRLLFILYAEDRGLLPYNRNSTYRRNRSLTAQHAEFLQGGHLAHHLLRPDSTAAWAYWRDLFDLIDRGHRTYGVTPYNGGLFAGGQHPFLENHVLTDDYAARVLDQLRRTIDPARPDDPLVNVDYRDLQIQHLGNVYEGLLELRPSFATEPMRAVRRRNRGELIERIELDGGPVAHGWELIEQYQPGQVVLQTDKGERRASGSYYTPDHIVDYIIERTIGPLCEEIDAALNAEIDRLAAQRGAARGSRREAIDADLERLRGDFDNRVLDLKVVDPSMGSGHFLIRACQFLAEHIATNPHTSDPAAPEEASGDEPTLLYWRRRVAEHCLFGVDRNGIAVELAKLALWLETASADQPLTFLDHHLKHGDSLMGARIEALGALPDATEMFSEAYRQQVAQRLPVLLRPLEEISATPSDDIEQVRAKDRLYRQAFEQAVGPFRLVADLWCSTFLEADDRQRVTAEQYQRVVNALHLPEFRRLAGTGRHPGEPWFNRAIERARAGCCFHWELEFPEVFLAPQRTAAGRAGFDAVIGNPPWEVLSEAESGHDLSALRRFLAAEPVYAPSFGGKNNLYKLFICRALSLLAEGGRFGFIVPMALLGDMQALGVRRAMLESGAFTSIDAFPQKDDPSRRVFPEAKLASAVFTYRKTADAAARARPFTARQHPERTFEDDAATLTLSTAAIPLYDPGNLSIVSCAQEDWDLATRIMSSGRVARLGEFVEFFQGEVNETNERARGTIGYEPTNGRLVTRGAGICLYVLRPPSQGEDFYVDVERFTAGKGPETKAFHHRHRRVGVQESCPQNNFRRIIASMIPADEFCNHKINYVPEPASRLPLEFILSLLNSSLADWYFRLGSTNAAVSHYQLYNLPCPLFSAERTAADERLAGRVLAEAAAGRTDAAFALLAPALEAPPFPLAVQDVLVGLVRRIIPLEAARGDIARTQRSHLSPQAQPLQDLIDHILFAAAGLTIDEARGLECRLATML